MPTVYHRINICKDEKKMHFALPCIIDKQNKTDYTYSISKKGGKAENR